MHADEPPRAGRNRLPQLIRPAGSGPIPAAPRRRIRLAGMARWLVALIAAWRARRRARCRLESWLTMDPRTLADIGLRPADVQVMAYAGAADAQIAARGGRWAATAGETVVEARRHTPQLRLAAGDDLDAAA